MISDSAFNILIGGEAGQGLVTVGEILAKSLVRSGATGFLSASFIKITGLPLTNIFPS